MAIPGRGTGFGGPYPAHNVSFIASSSTPSKVMCLFVFLNLRASFVQHNTVTRGVREG
jgi:hypothetical protein